MVPAKVPGTWLILKKVNQVTGPTARTGRGPGPGALLEEIQIFYFRIFFSGSIN